MKRLVEIRSYKLVAGSSAGFHSAFTQALSLVRAFGMEIVAFGPSQHEPDTYFLIREFRDLADREAKEAAFYGSDAWVNGPRQGVVSLIESYLDTVLWLDAQSIEDLRRSNAPPAGA